MRVGLVCPYALDVPGGVQSHVRQLAAYLCSRGHEVSVLAPGPGDQMPSGVTGAGRALPLRYNGSVARLAFGPGVSVRTRAWLVEGRFDVVHVHEPLAPSTSMLAMIHAECPMVATFHSAATAPLLVGAAGAVLRGSLERLRVRLAVSRFAASTVAGLPGPVPEVVPNGVDTRSFEVAAEAHEHPRVCFLGRFTEPRKGLDVFAAAAGHILARHPRAELLVAGPGAPRPAAGLRFLGELDDAARARYLAGADVYVAPNTGGESFGIILVEAMAAGAAVVASDLPAFAEVLEAGAGRLVETGSPRALASSVLDLLDEPGERALLGAAGRHRARRYDWAVVGPQVEDAYLRAGGRPA